MIVHIKRLHENAVIPVYAHYGDAGLDLTAVSKTYDKNGNVVFGTGLAMEIPYGHVGLLFPRSSVTKQTLSLANAVGVIDSTYRGEVIVKFKPTPAFVNMINDPEKAEYITLPTNSEIDEYAVGDRVAQLIILPYPHISFKEVEDLTASLRDIGGFGSTGK